MYKRILVGYDGSTFSDAALDEAISIARDSEAQITVVCAVERNYEMEAMAPELERKLGEKADEDLLKAEKIVKRSEVEYNRQEAIRDTPYKAIIDTAKKKKSDLIVVGTHGRTGLLRLLMGSTAERVIGHAPCSVLVVRSPGEMK